MAFQLVDFKGSSHGTRMEGLHNSNENIARVIIGTDTEAGVVYSALVILTEHADAEPGTYLLIFAITITGSGRYDVITDSEQTKAFLVGDDRRAVLDLICDMTKSVVRRMEASAIVFTNAVGFCPEKALDKYARICQALKTAGYKGGRSNSFDGYYTWMMVLDSDETNVD